MAKSLRLTIFQLFLMSFNFWICRGEIFSHLSECCKGGTRWAKEKTHCQNYQYAIEDIPPLYRGLCLSTFGMCCEKEFGNQQCIAGRNAARASSNCEGSREFNTTFFTTCCKACQIGLAVAASGNNCSSTYLEFAHDESYTLCCNDILEDNTFILAENDDICGKVQNLCSHICENTKDSYVCKCREGYKLDDNHVTCSRLPNSSQEEDEDFEDDEQDCKVGFAMNARTLHCDDIDECITGTSFCRRDQYCYNVPGSYKCLDIRSADCDEGYRFNTKTEECEDINECLEKIDDCRPADEACLNTRGSYKCVDKEKCPPGYYFDAIMRKCEDINECNDECRLRLSLPVIDRTSSYAAEPCGPGYRFKHNKCIDIDECLTDKNACDSNQNCINEQGAYHCDCKIGFKMEATYNACVDINECQVNLHNCLPSQRCDNTIGSYSCTRLQSCGTGYTLNAETGSCDDDNECLLGTHDCTVGYQCRNTEGSFRCDRIRGRFTARSTTSTTTRRPTTTTTAATTTPSTTTTVTVPRTRSTILYYSSTSSSTTAIPTTTPRYTPTHSRLSFPPYDQYTSHQTRNTEEYVPTSTNRFRVDTSCGYGFERNRMGACVDIDECQSSGTCGSHQRCINTNGSYRCENLLICSGGYKSTPDGTSCVDIDECETGDHNCGADELCRNRMGGYVCSCPAGHILSSGNRCVDINECEYKRDQVCSINSNCINTIGSYYCECKPGFKKQNDNDKNCVDIDECQEMPGLCEQGCINFWGSFRCACKQGYELSANNRSCNDINECEVHKAYNLCMGFCNNVQGSYECSCPPGYELGVDKNSCRDIDECLIPHTCSGRSEICTNIRGSYRCNHIQCPYGYTHDPDQKNRCRLINHICEGEECFQKPSAYTYNFITLVSKMLIPPQGRTLFTLRGPVWYENIDFDLKITKISAPPNIAKATEQHFSTNKMHNQVQLSLMRSLEGPQDIELELSMTVFMNGQPRGKSIAKIFIIVSQYSF